MTPSDDDLRRFLAGTLPADEAGRVAEWLASEPESESRLAALDTADSLADALRADTGAAAGDGARAPAASDLLADYHLGQEIGRGGMGVVYRAWDQALGRTVAVKVLREDVPPFSPLVSRFRTEARITARLQHPGVPAVHRGGLLPDGRPYLAMKLIDGRTLQELLDAPSDATARRADLLAAFEAVCQALAYAHAQGVIHRDLKPANVMVGAFGEVQVMDWGLAKPLGADEPARGEAGADDGRTAAGTLLGTPAYMAPEQAADAARIDRRADVFGLGSILCAILTGQPPYVGTAELSVRQLAAAGDVSPAFVRLDGCGAEADWVALCRRCLAPAAEDRPPDAAAVAAAARAIRDSAAERARRAELERGQAEVRAAEQRKRRRVQAWAAAAVILVLAGGAAVSGWLAIRATDAEARTGDQLTKTSAAEAAAVSEANLARAAEAAAEAAAADARREQAEAVKQQQRAEGVAAFLAGLFEATDPIGLGTQSGMIHRRAGETLPAIELLRRGVTAARQSKALEPGARLTLLTRIGFAAAQQGDGELAQQALTAAAEVAAGFPADGPEAAALAHAQGFVHEYSARYRKAEQAYRAALRVRERLAAARPTAAARLDLAETQFALAVLLAQVGDYAVAETFAAAAYAARKELLGEDGRPTVLAALAVSAAQLGQPNDAKRIVGAATGAAAVGRAVAIDGNPVLGEVFALFQGAVLDKALRGDGAAATAKLRRCAAAVERLIGTTEHPYYALVFGILSLAEAAAGAPTALDDMLRTFHLARRLRFLTYPAFGQLFERLLPALARAGRAAEADEIGRAWLAEHERNDPDTDFHAAAFAVVAVTDAATGHPVRGRLRLEAAFRILRGLGEHEWHVQPALAVALAAAGFGLHEQAAETFGRARARLPTMGAEDTADANAVALLTARQYTLAGKRDLAAPLLREAAAGFRRHAPNHPLRMEAALELSRWLRDARRFGEAVPELEWLAAEQARRFGASDPRTLYVVHELGVTHLENGQGEKGMPYWRSVLELAGTGKKAPPVRWVLESAAAKLADQYDRAGDADEARKYREQAAKFAAKE